MSDAIRTAFTRIESLLTTEPARGRDTAVTRVRIGDGLRCEISEGAWQLVADMPKNVGGSETAPTPGVYGRAALGSCLAIGYSMWAAKLGVPIEAVEVEIQADFDSGALFGVADVPAGYSEVRYSVSVVSSASTADVTAVLDEADRHSPYLDVFSRAQSVRREVHVRATSDAVAHGDS